MKAITVLKHTVGCYNEQRLWVYNVNIWKKIMYLVTFFSQKEKRVVDKKIMQSAVWTEECAFKLLFFLVISPEIKLVTCFFSPSVVLQ